MDPKILIGILETILASPQVQDEVRQIVLDAIEKLEEHLAKQGVVTS